MPFALCDTSVTQADDMFILQDRPYDRWLRLLLSHITEHSSNKDKFFSQFVIDLPVIPSEEVERLGVMCMNPEQCVLPSSAVSLD